MSQLLKFSTLNVIVFPASQALKKAQTERGVQRPLGLIQDVVTRWNSQLSMVNRLLELQTYLFAVCHGGMHDGKEVMTAKDRRGLYPVDSTWKVS